MNLRHLNHDLIVFNDSNIINAPTQYEAFKCKKCNRIIFYYKYRKQEIYWNYANGLDYVDRWFGWQKLTLTCEEQLIKSLLE